MFEQPPFCRGVQFASELAARKNRRRQSLRAVCLSPVAGDRDQRTKLRDEIVVDGTSESIVLQSLPGCGVAELVPRRRGRKNRVNANDLGQRVGPVIEPKKMGQRREERKLPTRMRQPCSQFSEPIL